MTIDVCGGRGSAGASLEGGGVTGPESIICAGVFATGVVTDSWRTVEYGSLAHQSATNLDLP